MVENVIQIKIGITINVDVNIKNIDLKNVTFGTLLHVAAKLVNI